MISIVVAIAVLGAVYPVLVYPLLVLALGRIRPKPWLTGPASAEIAHIVTVYNEEARIAKKLQNCVSLKWPTSCPHETIVASDGSTDGTERIVREFADRGIRWLACPRRGKEAAQIDAVRSTRAPLLVFSDAAALLEPEALDALLEPFRDPSVLAVSGTDVLEAQDVDTGEGLYVRFEMAVRRAESLAGSLVGLSGCFFAVRREIALQWIPGIPSDMASALLSIAAGGRAVAARDARCVYSVTRRAGSEFARKRRTALRGLRCLWHHRRTLSPTRPLVSWEILSHKWWRFSMPFWIVAALASALLALAVWWPVLAWLAVGALLLVVAWTWIAGRSAVRGTMASRATVFLGVSLAAVFAAWSDFLRGRDEATWTPTARSWREGQG